MGNNHSHPSSDEKSQTGSTSGTATPRRGSRKGLVLSASGSDIQEKFSTHMMQIDKLAKILTKKTHDEDGLNNIISEQCFTFHLFPKYRDLGEHLFRYLVMQSKSKNPHLITPAAFRQQVDRFLAIFDDVTEVYIKMFCEYDQDCMMIPEGLTTLLMTCYKLSMDHYSDGPQTCLSLPPPGADDDTEIHKTLRAVVDSCFHTKHKLSGGYVARWLEEHCHRLVLPMHRYCVHILSTAWRTMDRPDADDGSGLELATPILEAPPPLPAPPLSQRSPPSAPLMPVSRAWLLAGCLPASYSKPHNANSPGSSGVNLASTQFLTRLVCLLPSHWTLLYTSRNHGLGANRFLHHVTGYRGPTLLLIQGGTTIDGGDPPLLCLAASSEWKESHLYTGGEDCALIQIAPKFSLMEKAPKMLYLNTSIRGYPKGLRAGSDPRKYLIAIDEGFEKVEFRGITYPLDALEVWGCGDVINRETQLDIKKWEVKEAERQRTVKLSTSDWMDHPDRYLLELAGRPQYNNSTS